MGAGTATTPGGYGKCAGEHELGATTASDAIKIVRWFGDRQLELLHSHRFGWLRTKAEKLHKILMRHPGRQATLGALAKSHCCPPNVQWRVSQWFLLGSRQLDRVGRVSGADGELGEGLFEQGVVGGIWRLWGGLESGQ